MKDLAALIGFAELMALECKNIKKALTAPGDMDDPQQIVKKAHRKLEKLVRETGITAKKWSPEMFKEEDARKTA